ncbi:MAG: hypothetical protein IJS67_04365 [Clostridia bacterium]|nr:hypothetical protein [Clostridia bacterium]
MKVDIRRKRTRIFVLTQLLVLTMLCFTLYAVSVGVKRSGRTAGAEQTATYMNIESYDLEWDANRSLRQAVGKATIYGGGNFVESYEKLAMTVWHFPKVADVKLSADVRRYYNQGTAQLYFRIVHEHARTGLNEVVFSYDGSWYDLKGP